MGVISFNYFASIYVTTDIKIIRLNRDYRLRGYYSLFKLRVCFSLY